jgi:hypothetical protein
MANKGHDHTVGQDGLVHHQRVDDSVTHDTGRRVQRGELASPPQQYIDHAGRPTTVKEYKSGAVDVMVGADQTKYWAKERIVQEARNLATSTDWKATGDRFRGLLDEWKAVGRIDKNVDDKLWTQFSTARQSFQDARQRHFDQRKAAESAASATKNRLASRAESLASASDLKSAGEEMKRLADEWKAAGRASRDEEDRLWARFNAARTRLNDRRSHEYEKRKSEWANNKASKERLVTQAESVAMSSDLKAAAERMRSLGDEWRKIGPCEKADNDRLWTRFNAARSRLTQRKTQEFEKRKAEWANNKQKKQAIVSRMQSLSHASDLRAAKNEARALSDQWRAIGPCEKVDNDRLWNDFKSAKDALMNAAKREAQQRAREQVSRLEMQLHNVESALIRANESYSRALSARSPSMKNPNWSSIVRSQQLRVSNSRDKIVSMQNRRNEIVTRLMQARDRLNRL